MTALALVGAGIFVVLGLIAVGLVVMGPADGVRGVEASRDEWDGKKP